MEAIFTSVLFVGLVACGTFVYLVTRHLHTMREVTPQSGDLTGADRYRPMLRLLSESDFAYLQEGGWSTSMLRRARADRRQLFRCYLRSLVKDHSQLMLRVRAILVESNVDRPDLAQAIARNRMLFTIGLLRIELHLYLHALGMNNVDVSGLVALVESLRGQTCGISTSQLSAVAGAR